jgi:DNA-binding LacI/PurR family transcriptional regulator
MEEIGKYAVQMIVDKIQNQQTSTKTITLSPHMVQRNSVKSLVPEPA